jgi:hypothetical protein
MKKLNLIVATLFFCCSLFAVTGAFAQAKKKTNSYDQDSKNSKSSKGENSKSKDDGNDDGNHGSSSNKGKTSLPIDSHVWFLFAAGIAVGCKVLLNKSKLTAARDI